MIDKLKTLTVIFVVSTLGSLLTIISLIGLLFIGLDISVTTIQISLGVFILFVVFTIVTYLITFFIEVSK